MSAVVELARLRESSVKGHHVYRASFRVGEVFTCERELTNRHSAWAIVVKKPESSEVAGHVPDDVARVLFPLLSSGEILSMKCAITGLSKAAEEGVWVQGGGIVIPCTYILYGKQLDRPHVRSERKKNSRKKRTRVEDWNGPRSKTEKIVNLLCLIS